MEAAVSSIEGPCAVCRSEWAVWHLRRKSGEVGGNLLLLLYILLLSSDVHALNKSVHESIQESTFVAYLWPKFFRLCGEILHVKALKRAWLTYHDHIRTLAAKSCAKHLILLASTPVEVTHQTVLIDWLIDWLSIGPLPECTCICIIYTYTYIIIYYLLIYLMKEGYDILWNSFHHVPFPLPSIPIHVPCSTSSPESFDKVAELAICKCPAPPAFPRFWKTAYDSIEFHKIVKDNIR